MGTRYQRRIEKINRIIEGLEDITLGDPKAWTALSAELKKTLAPAPKALPELIVLQQSVAAGLKRVASGGVGDLLSALDVLAAALRTAADALAGKAAHGALAASAAALDAAFAPAAALEAPPPSATIEGLDDAAAFLVGLEPGDGSGWRRLAAALEQLAQDQECAAPRRDRLLEAVERCGAIAGGKVEECTREVARIGALLEEAMAETALPAASEEAPPAMAEPEAGPALEARDHMPENPDPELLAEFIAESTDLIQNAEEALLSLENDPADMEAVGRVFRAFHTVKGTAGFLELTLIAELGHHAETLLSRVRDGEIRYGGGYADLCLKALDTIKHLVATVQQALAGRPLLKPAGYDELMEVLRKPEAAGVSEEQPQEAVPRLGEILVARGKAAPGQIDAALSEHPDEPLGMALVKNKAVAVSDVGQALRAQQQIRGAGAVVDASVRVNTQRLDRLIDMVGELVIAHSMVAQDPLVVNGEHHGLAKKVAHTSKIVRELQDISMSMRMVPLKATFSKMARLVRDVARKLGKNVNLVTEGEDTEIDRNLVDIINDPLVHMVRNAVDHGLETPDQRRAAGKPLQGTVRLSAYHSAGSVVVEISDDGKGLDREVILAKARERGLLGEAPENGERSLSDRDVFNLIFEPGFSTATVVTDVSGRGVGMDVVRRNIELLRGQVEIKSEKGAGSTFKMSLPLTLAIIDGMVIRVGRETYVVPTISILRSVKPAAGDISTVLQKGEMLRLQGRLMPLYRLAQIYGIEGGGRELSEAIVVVVEDEGRPAGLVVDELVGRQQVVIKSLGETMKNIPGISGGAIMPDGRVGLILDVGSLLRLAAADRAEGSGARLQARAA